MEYKLLCDRLFEMNKCVYLISIRQATHINAIGVYYSYYKTQRCFQSIRIGID